MKPLAIDLYAGLGGWSSALLAEGYQVVGFDIEQHVYGEHRYPAQLVLQDVLTLHGRRFKDAALIVASPPCQQFSYMAMPWTRAKQIRRALQGDGDFPEGYTGSRTVAELTALFDACFRIQAEASEAAGHHIPLVVENVRGAQEWVGRARWRFGSFYLWGDVPALMPMTGRAMKNAGGSWFRVSHNNVPHSRGDAIKHTPHMTDPAEHIKCGGIDLGEKGFNIQAAERYGPLVDGAPYARTADDIRQHIGIKRKFASAMIAKIPEPLARHIARVYRP